MIIFYKTLLYAFLLLFCGAMPLAGCFNKNPEEIPPTMEDDEVLVLIKKDISDLEKELRDMKRRMEISEKSLEEFALKPDLLELNRKEFFQYDKMYRQIDQLIAYHKIKLSLRERDLKKRLEGLKKSDLKKEFEEFQISREANKKTYPWSDLDPPEYSLKGEEKPK